MFEENLPLNGKVKCNSDGKIYVYHGFESPRPRRCCCTLPDEPFIVWIDRTVLEPHVE